MKNLLTLKNYFLLCVAAMPLYLLRINFFGLPTNLFELGALLALVIWFVTGFGNHKAKLRSIPPFIFGGVFLLLTGILLSAIANPISMSGLGIIKSWFLLPIFFSYALFSLIENELDIKRVLQAIFVSASAVSLVAIAYKALGLVTYDARLSAFYGSPNYLAMYLAPAVIFGFFLALAANTGSKERPFYVTASIPILLAFFWTYSYAAWAATLMAIFLALYLTKPKRRMAVALCAAIVAFLIIFSQLQSNKFSTLLQADSRSSLASRIMIWKSSFLMIKNHPITGIGPGNFQQTYLAYQKYFPPYLEWAVPEPHNLLLAFWLQTGLAGLLGFLFVIFYAIFLLLQIIKAKENTALAAALLAFFLYTFLHGLFDTPFWKNDLSMLFWLCIFISISLYRARSSKKL
ncbi:MAG TPA: O-antigen ligase family protein [Patescibacteria group bacterium]